MTKLAFLIDKDGVLLDNREIHYTLWRETFEVYGITLNKDEFYRYLIGTPVQNIANYLSRKLGKQINENELLSTYRNLERRLAPPIRTMDGAKELIDYLHRNRIPFAIVTSSSLQRTTRQLRELFGIVPPYIISIEVVLANNRKPKPSEDHYLLALEILEKNYGPFDKVYIIDDSDVILDNLLRVKHSHPEKFEIIGIGSGKIEGVKYFRTPREFLEYLKLHEARDFYS